MKEEMFIKQKELAIKMWTGIKNEISKHGKDFDWKCLEDYKQDFCDNEKLVWKYNCFLCNFFLVKDVGLRCSSKCGLMYYYNGVTSLGCSCITAPYIHVSDNRLSTESRLAACDNIIEAIKELTLNNTKKIVRESIDEDEDEDDIIDDEELNNEEDA